MAVVSETNSQFKLPWLNLESNNYNQYNPIQFKNSNIVLHSPHPSRIRHITTFDGTPICVVDTEDKCRPQNQSVLFPPNQYVDNKLKMADRTFHLPFYRDNTNLVTARPSLDTILAMKYFTGLRNTSFKDQPPASIDIVNNDFGWEAQLRQLTTEAIAPVMEKFKGINLDRPCSSSQRPSSSGAMKRMYSSSGRLLTPKSVSRPSTCSARRLSTAQRPHRLSEDFLVTPEIDTQVFYLLGGILQNSDPEVVKTWLLTSTERERNLMISILRSALIDKDELNIFVAEASKEKPSRIVYTPAKVIDSRLPTIRESVTENQRDILIVQNETINQEQKPMTRPPTSSTFRTNKTDVLSRPNTRNGDEWIPSESFIVK